MDQSIIIAKTWRGEWLKLVAFVVLSMLSIFFSARYPGSIIRGDLFSIFGYKVYLSLPLFWFLPAGAIGTAIWRIYDVRYSVDRRGIEARVGVLAFSQRIVRVRFEDVRSIEVDQTLIERFLGIGNLLVGTAATSGVEIYLEGIGAPHEVQQMVQAERDKRAQMILATAGTEELVKQASNSE